METNLPSRLGCFDYLQGLKGRHMACQDLRHRRVELAGIPAHDLDGKSGGKLEGRLGRHELSGGSRFVLCCWNRSYMRCQCGPGLPLPTGRPSKSVTA